MASGTINLTSSDSKLAGKIEWSSVSNGSSANTSTVTASLYVRRTDSYTTKGTWSGEMEIAGTIQSFSHSSTSISSDWVLMKSFSATVSHNDNGTGSCWISGYCNAPTGTALEGVIVNGGQTVTLDTIARYAKFTVQQIDSKGLNWVKVKWATDKTIESTQYSLNGGAWTNLDSWTNTGSTFSIKNLNPNTSYTVKIKVSVNGLDTISNTLTVSTYDIGKISSVSNFEHGSSTNISITNPSGATLNLVMKIGNTQIFSRAVTTNTTSISFGDTELDNIYKLYGSSSSLTATFILTTASTYTNSKTCTITLKGNQKTIRENVSGTWKRGKIWVNVNGTWKRGVIWENVNGTWKRGI